MKRCEYCKCCCSFVDMKQVENDMTEILDHFDFQRVLEVITALNWHGLGGFPEIWELRKKARNILEKAVKGLIASGEKGWVSSCGGFLAEADILENDPKIYINLSFVISEWNNYEND